MLSSKGFHTDRGVVQYDIGDRGRKHTTNRLYEIGLQAKQNDQFLNARSRCPTLSGRLSIPVSGVILLKCTKRAVQAFLFKGWARTNAYRDQYIPGYHTVVRSRSVPGTVLQ